MSRAGWIVTGAAAAAAATASIASAGLDGPQTVTVAEGPVDIEIGRVTKDGRPDAVVANRTAGVISVLPGRPDGLGQPRELAFPGQPRSLALGRINRGPRLDLVAGDLAEAESVWVLLQRRNGTFRKRKQAMRSPVSDVGLGDVNGDGRTDLVALSGLSPPTVSVRLQKPNGRFRRAKVRPAGDPTGDPQQVAVGDLNRDGRADIAVSDRLEDEINLLYGKRSGLRARKQLAGGGSPEGLEIARLDPGRTADLVAVNRGGGDVSVFYGKRNRKLRAPVDYPVAAELLADVAIGNFDGGRRDLVVTADFAGTFYVLAGEPGGFAPAQGLAGEIGIGAVEAGRLNGDGRDDFAAIAFSDDSLTAYFGD